MQAIDQIGTIIKQINEIQGTIASAVEEQTATTNEIARNIAEAAKGSHRDRRNITSVAQAASSTTEGDRQHPRRGRGTRPARRRTAEAWSASARADEQQGPAVREGESPHRAARAVTQIGERMPTSSAAGRR